MPFETAFGTVREYGYLHEQSEYRLIGVPDEKWGSSVRAVVQLKEGKNATEEEIIGVCEGKLAGYKKPSSVIFVDDFPLSPFGKVLRSKIRELHGKP